jgi:hypothetical protein
MSEEEIDDPKIRAESEALCRRLPLEPLKLLAREALLPNINKCGVIPYRITEKGEIEVYLYKPVAKKQKTGEVDTLPLFQIAKGTRKMFKNGEWVNYEPSKLNITLSDDPLSDAITDDTTKAYTEHGIDKIESVDLAAIRESIEEIGLPTKLVSQLCGCGKYEYQSASSEEKRFMWLMAAELPQDAIFNQPAEAGSKTAETGWFNPMNETDIDQIRVDNREILKDIVKNLTKKINQSKERTL